MKAIEKRRQMAGQGGFTLIELLIVIAILGILAAVVVFAVGNVTENAQDKACQIEVRAIETALEAYRGNSDNPGGNYPTQWSDIVGQNNTNGFLKEAPDTAVWGATPPSDGNVVAVSGSKCA